MFKKKSDCFSCPSCPSWTFFTVPPIPNAFANKPLLTLVFSSHLCYSATLILFGQILCLCVSLSGVTSQLLVDRHSISVPTFQNSLNYFTLFLVFFPCLVWKGNFISTFRDRWWKYLLIAIIDVEGNYLMVKAYSLTSLTSVQVLDCFTIPTVMFLSYFVLKHRYKWSHYVGALMSLGGIVALILSDSSSQTSGSKGSRPFIGDAVCLMGACLYAISNVCQEYMIKNLSAIEFLAFIGFFGTVICGVQGAALEYHEIASISWSWEIVSLFFGFNACLFCMYSLVPIFILMSSASILNISLLAADIYSFFFGLFLFQAKFSYLYIIAFLVILLGVVLYNGAPVDHSHEYESLQSFTEEETDDDFFNNESSYYNNESSYNSNDSNYSGDDNNNYNNLIDNLNHGDKSHIGSHIHPLGPKTSLGDIHFSTSGHGDDRRIASLS